MNRTSALMGAAVVLLLISLFASFPQAVTTTTTDPKAPATSGPLSLTGRLSHPYLVAGANDVFATLAINATELSEVQRAPINIALVIDRSGSMSGSKIENARRAAGHLVNMLNANDRLSVVHYGSDVTVFDGLFATSENKLKMHRFIDAIRDEGGTNMGEGLKAGKQSLEQAKSNFRVNRLILLSDGQPTVGMTSTQELTQLIHQVRESGMSVTSLGVGADFNENLMQHLADVGGGSYGFISDAQAMAGLFEKDFKQAGTMVAQGASLHFTLPEGMRFVETYGRPSSQTGNTVTIGLPDFSAGQVEKVVLHLTASPPVQHGPVDIATFELAYVDVLTQRNAQARLSLTASVTTDNALALRNRDPEATVSATRAQAAANYQKAAEAIERGDYAMADQTLHHNASLFTEAESVVGAGKMTEERDIGGLLMKLSNTAPAAPAPQRQEAVKQMKNQSLRSSGRGSSVY